MITLIDLTQGLSDNKDYKAFKFPGGELHFILKKFDTELYEIKTRLNSSEDIILLCLAVDTIKKDSPYTKIKVHIPYMPYQQADRDFGIGECFSLKTITKILNTLDVNEYIINDPHSDVSPALLKNAKIIDNSEFIKWVLDDLKNNQYNNTEITKELIWLSPDAGAYKKIGKLASKIGWSGEIAAANKYRSISSGTIENIELSLSDFGNKDILIIDDICMGGNTFIKLAEKLRTKNVRNMFLAVSHMIPETPNMKLEIFETIYSTNSRYENYFPSIDLKIFKL